MLQFLDEIFFKLEMGYAVDVVYLDFAKAFDKVSYQKPRVSNFTTILPFRTIKKSTLGQSP